MATPETDLPADEQPVEESETPRDAWLSLALTDPDLGAAALATAARHGRPLPPREA
jgi:hypothetical protein